MCLYVEYSRTLILFFEDFKFAYKTTKFYAKWLVRNFGQKSQKLCTLAHYFQIKARGTHTPNPWSAFPEHVVGELPCGSQPTAPTCVVWSWRLIDSFAHHLGSKRFLRRGFPPFINPTALSRWWTHIRAKQLSLLRARYGCGLVYVFHLL